MRPLAEALPLSEDVYRTRGQQLLHDAAKGGFKVALVFRLDRALRSVKHMHDTLHAWDTLGIGFKRLREQFDTSTALGRLLLNLLAPLAEVELELIRERVGAGMAGRPGTARKSVGQGLRIGEASRPATKWFWSASQAEMSQGVAEGLVDVNTR